MWSYPHTIIQPIYSHQRVSSLQFFFTTLPWALHLMDSSNATSYNWIPHAYLIKLNGSHSPYPNYPTSTPFPCFCTRVRPHLPQSNASSLSTTDWVQPAPSRICEFPPVHTPLYIAPSEATFFQLFCPTPPSVQRGRNQWHCHPPTATPGTLDPISPECGSYWEPTVSPPYLASCVDNAILTYDPSWYASP
jgi:hypothetical protein